MVQELERFLQKQSQFMGRNGFLEAVGLKQRRQRNLWEHCRLRMEKVKVVTRVLFMFFNIRHSSAVYVKIDDIKMLRMR
ncbi:unnamed protein product [Cuscuta campestris]|uniref:Uncharacterized protein n=1 Tax=Cuscuta campestris TaxID=132261 RepID=A0A484LAN1_9ASTE|nr:unnamed protein product [Cuscuta campestris]